MIPKIQTFTGRTVTPLDIQPDQIVIEDIAHHLSMICRFNGATKCHYSVAEHSVRVAIRLHTQGHAEAARYGLLHDASEAYLSDISAPLKSAHELDGYCNVENHCQEVIYARFGLQMNSDYHQLATHADLELLATERKELLVPALDDIWMKLPAPLEGPQGMGWAPSEAERRFLWCFQRLFPMEVCDV
jgi:hypothetical protein